MDLNTAIHPLVIVSKWFGLGPFALSVPKPASGRPSYVHSRWALAYSVVWTALMLAALHATVPPIFLDRPQRMATIMETTSTLQAVCGILVFIYSHLACFVNRDVVTRLIATLGDVGDALGLTSSRFVTIRRVVIAQVCLALTLEVISAVLLAAGWGIPLTAEKVVTFTLICVAEMANGLAELQFVSFVLMANLLYKAFCAKLDAIPKHLTGRRVHAYTPVSTMSSELDTCVEATGDGLKDDEDIDGFGDRDVSSLHCFLHDVSKTVGSLFGFQSLLFIINDFCALLYGLYFVSDFCLGLSQPNSSNIVWLAYLVYEAFFRSFRLVVMVTSCSLVTAKAEDLAYTVSKLQTSARDEETRLQMQTFSSQLVHRRVRFTACGLLPIDASLISAVVGGVTTYLVIIIQFQMMNLPPSQLSSSSSTPPPP